MENFLDCVACGDSEKEELACGKIIYRCFDPAADWKFGSATDIPRPESNLPIMPPAWCPKRLKKERACRGRK